MNHEHIHIKQQIELGILFFYPIYVLEFLFHLAKTLNRNRAYRLISFEREAYANDKNPDYLKTRKMWGMWRIGYSK